MKWDKVLHACTVRSLARDSCTEHGFEVSRAYTRYSQNGSWFTALPPMYLLRTPSPTYTVAQLVPHTPFPMLPSACFPSPHPRPPLWLEQTTNLILEHGIDHRGPSPSSQKKQANKQHVSKYVPGYTSKQQILNSHQHNPNNLKTKN